MEDLVAVAVVAVAVRLAESKCVDKVGGNVLAGAGAAVGVAFAG